MFYQNKKQCKLSKNKINSIHLKQIFQTITRMQIFRNAFIINFVLAVFIFSNPAGGQNKYADSLAYIINKNANDTNHCKALIELSWTVMQQNPDSAKTLLKMALPIALKTKNDFLLAKSYNITAIAQTMTGQMDEAISNYNLCMKIYERTKDSLGIAAVLNNIGNVYRYRGWYDMALQYFLQSIKIEEANGDTQRISEGYVNLGAVYGELPDNKNALFYFNKSRALLNDDTSNTSMAGIYTNIGSIMASMQENDSALYFSNLAIQLAKKNDDLYNISVAYTGLGYAYSNKKEYGQALKYHNLSFDYAKQIDDVNGMAQSTMNMGDVYLLDNHYTEAIEWSTKSIDFAKQAQALNILKKNYSILAQAYSKRGDFKNAYSYQDLYNVTSDSLLNDAKQKTMEEMKVKFETEKKEKENKILAQQNEIKDLAISTQKTRIIILITIISLLALLGYIFYIINRSKQKEILNREILKQQELRSKAVIDAEESERQRIGQDLHDGVGQLLSAAKMNVSNLQSILKIENDEQQINLQNAIDMIDESAKEVRSISHNMMPNMLIKSGLAKAIREFVDKISSSGKLKVELEIIGLDKPINKTTESFLFRILQELINNIIKHSQANFVSIQLVRHDNEITLMVEDNGKGFNYNKAMQQDGAGIKNIISRVAFLNGNVNFDSTLDKGTTVVIELPV